MLLLTYFNPINCDILLAKSTLNICLIAIANSEYVLITPFSKTSISASKLESNCLKVESNDDKIEL